MILMALVMVILSNFSLANLPADGEAGFARASIAFQEGKLNDAGKLVEKLLTKYPDEIQIIELKALILKSQGHLEKSKNVYLELVKKAQLSKNHTKIPAYAFELGNILYSQGKLKEAHRYLKTATTYNFNKEASEFLLGKIDFEQNNWALSREHFEAASRAEAFRTVSKLQLARAYQKEDRVTDALGAFVDAKESALLDMSSQGSVNEQVRFLAQQVLKNSEQELRSFSKNQWTKEIGVATAYDSNVLSMPNSTDANNTSTTGSTKQSANWRLRYASDPTEHWQYLGTYQGSINYNFNQKTEAGQFFVQDLTNFLTRGYLKSTQYGLKIGGTGIFQFQIDAYKPFSLSGSFGPYTRIELSDTWSLGLEAFFQPNRNYLDPTLSDSSKRSGWDQVFRTYLASRVSAPYWTPSVFLTGTLLRPSGSDFSGTRLNLDFANAMYLSSKVFFAQVLGVSASRFPNRTNGERNDQGFSAGLSGGYQVTGGLTLMAQLDYTQNLSSDSNFRYHRWNTAISGNYRF